MDQSTQQNAAMVEEIAAAAGGLRHEANQLVEAVSTFKLGGGPSVEHPSNIRLLASS